VSANGSADKRRCVDEGEAKSLDWPVVWAVPQAVRRPEIHRRKRL